MPFESTLAVAMSTKRDPINYNTGVAVVEEDVSTSVKAFSLHIMSSQYDTLGWPYPEILSPINAILIRNSSTLHCRRSIDHNIKYIVEGTTGERELLIPTHIA